MLRFNNHQGFSAEDRQREEASVAEKAQATTAAAISYARASSSAKLFSDYPARKKVHTDEILSSRRSTEKEKENEKRKKKGNFLEVFFE
jgi:hypothetical protein